MFNISRHLFFFSSVEPSCEKVIRNKYGYHSMARCHVRLIIFLDLCLSCNKAQESPLEIFFKTVPLQDRLHHRTGGRISPCGAWIFTERSTTQGSCGRKRKRKEEGQVRGAGVPQERAAWARGTQMMLKQVAEDD